MGAGWDIDNDWVRGPGSPREVESTGNGRFRRHHKERELRETPREGIVRGTDLGPEQPLRL
jgi:hypothetical protein